MSKFKRVQFKEDIEVSLSSHQTLLSFFDDDGNYAFREWWKECGSSQFNEWCSKSEEYKRLSEKD